MPHKHKVKGKWTGKWHGQVKCNGTRIGGRPLFDTRAGAVAWEAETRKALKNPPQEPQPIPLKTVTVSSIDWANKYLDYSLRYSPKTYSEKKGAFRRLIQTIGKETCVSSITAGQALEHIQAVFKARTGHAANKERKNLVAAWSWGSRYLEGFPNVNPFLLVPKFPEDAQERYVPPERDFWKVAGIAEGQERVLLAAFLHTAARRGEIYRLKWSDVDFGSSKIRLTTRKREGGGLQADWIPMTEELFGILLEHKQGSESEWVFTQPRGRQKGKAFTENRGFPQELCERAGVKPFGCHAIRHLTASILAGRNVPMVVIQQILRHKKLATTERYVRGLEPVRPHLSVLEGGFSGARSNGGSNTKEKGSGVRGS